jgi:precorrin-2 dehydrogenase / sirohydrochlorin ferrochelatase
MPILFIEEIRMIPLLIDVKDKNVLIVGGGKIALRRLMLFIEEGANITVVSPVAAPEIMELSRLNKINWLEKKVELTDLQHAFIVIAATNDPAINEWIAENVSKNQLINVVSYAEKGNVTVPKSVKRGRLTLAVSTNGASPKLASQICEQLSSQFDDRFIKELDQMYENRTIKKNKKS